MSDARYLTDLDPMIEEYINSKLIPHGLFLDQARTAEELWKRYNFPRCGLVGWFSERLRDVGCQVSGRGFAPGAKGRPLFDPDRASGWIRNGGRLFVEQEIARKARGHCGPRLVSG